MSIQTKILAVLIPIFLVVFLAHSFFTYRAVAVDIKTDMRREAHSIRAVLMATRRIYHRQFLDSGLPVDDTTIGFLPAHAMGLISRDFPNWTDSGIIFNNVSDRARNPKNSADKIELAAMDYFRQYPDVDEQFKLIDVNNDSTSSDTANYYHYTQPIWIEEYCLECHGNREDAPASIQANYSESFGYKVGDLRGVLSIKIPAKDAQARAWAILLSGIGVNLIGYAGAFAGIYALLLRTAVSRLKTLESGARELAQGNYAWRSGITGNDEISKVAAVFDQMAGQVGDRDTALRASERRFRDVIESGPDAMVIINSDRCIVVVNAKAEEMFGYSRSEMLGQPVEMLIPVRFRDGHPDKVQGFFENPRIRPLDEKLLLQGIHKNSTEFPIEVCLGPISTEDGLLVASSIRNITSRKELEKQSREHRENLSHVTRVSTIGEMATGIAHELNQPLAAIATYSHTLKSILDTDSFDEKKIRELAHKMENQSIRAGDILRQLRSLVRKTASVRIVTDLNTLVHDVAKFVAPDITAAEIELKTDLCEQLPNVEIDEIQIQQVLINLVKNAIDAMEQTPENQRVVIISTRVNDKNAVELAVCDTGTGLEAENVECIFEAFHSTKEQGMGMGLAISRSIIEDHGGTLKAEENEISGMTFRFTVPTVEAAVESVSNR